MPERLAAGVSEPKRLDVLLLAGFVLTLCLFNYLHDAAKMLMESDFVDYAHYYIFATAAARHLGLFDADLLGQLGEVGRLVHAAGEPVYPPVFYLLMVPLTRLSYEPSTWLWMAMSQSFLLGSFWLCIGRHHEASIIRVLVAGLIVLTYQPIRETLFLGQTNLLILGLATAAWWALREDRPWLAGIMVALTVSNKIQFGLLVPLLWWMGYRQAAVRSMLALSAMTAVAWMQLGTEHFVHYVQQVSRYSDELAAWSMNMAPRAVLYRLLGDTAEGRLWAEGLWLTGSALLLLWVAVVTRPVEGRGGYRLDWSWGIGLTAVLLISPMSEEHHFTVLLLPLLLLALSAPLQEFTGRDWVLLCGTLILLGGRYSFERFPSLHHGLSSLVMTGKTIGLGLLLWILSERLRAVGRRESTQRDWQQKACAA
ncbi:MAG: DUF2029 domain-containing protein [Nitrospiraceae bacterium]|nr:DUF2029 domain-containing protein [Nitrospiraceae bacterium]